MMWVVELFKNISNFVNCKFTHEDVNIDQRNYIKIEVLDCSVIAGVI
jgi:hypothetical protein